MLQGQMQIAGQVSEASAHVERRDRIAYLVGAWHDARAGARQFPHEPACFRVDTFDRPARGKDTPASLEPFPGLIDLLIGGLKDALQNSLAQLGTGLR